LCSSSASPFARMCVQEPSLSLTRVCAARSIRKVVGRRSGRFSFKNQRMPAPVSNSGFQAAMSILSHLYFAPILGRLIRARVPDLVADGAVPSAELAHQAGLHPLSTVRAMRALTAFGVFREVAPGAFANSEASS